MVMTFGLLVRRSVCVCEREIDRARVCVRERKNVANVVMNFGLLMR